MSTTIIIRDMARRALERATDGKQTILYTLGGQPCVMNVIPKFMLSDIISTWPASVFPAFISGTTQISQIFIGTYQASLSGSVAVSAPMAAPLTNVTHDAAVNLARANGVGWHAMTAIESAAIALLAWRAGTVPRGNNWWGTSIENTAESGVRVDGLAPGTESGSSITLTGSGPDSWRHDGTPFGISDLNGNCWEITPGIRLVAGELQATPNNLAAGSTTDIGPNSTNWRVFDATSSALVVPTYTGSIDGGDYVPTTPNSVRINTSAAANSIIIPTATGTAIGNVTTNNIVDVALRNLMAYGLLPPAIDASTSSDYVKFNASSERILLRGNHSQSKTQSGVFSWSLYESRASSASALATFRLAYAVF